MQKQRGTRLQMELNSYPGHGEIYGATWIYPK